MFPVIRPKLLTDAAFVDAAVFPSSIQPLKSFSGEPGSRVVTEDQVGIRDCGVLFFVPGLAHAEVDRRAGTRISDGTVADSSPNGGQNQ